MLKDKASKEVNLVLDRDKMFDICPECGEKMKHRYARDRYEDDSAHVRWCHNCDTAYIWYHNYD